MNGSAGAVAESQAHTLSDPERCCAAGTAANWPLSTYLELGALPSAVPSARLHARLVLAEWGLPERDAEPVELVVGELTTNAVMASQGLTGTRFAGKWSPGTPPVRLCLRSDRSRVLVQVWDAHWEMPQRQEAAADADHGRGLLLVAALCERYGAYVPGGSTGKVVYALLTPR